MADINDFDITDGSGNMVDTNIDSMAEADPLIHPDAIGGDPVIIADATLNSGLSNKVIKFDLYRGLLKQSGQLFSGTVDYIKLYDKNVLLYDTGATLVLTAANLAVVSGELTITQTEVTTGTLNSLSAGTDYWFYLFNTDMSVISIGIIQLVLE